jgi:glycosyltransferase involved in cell wall biosynthesis
MARDGTSTKLLWLKPDKPQNISVGRERVSRVLSRRGFDVTVRGTNRRTVVISLRELDEYDVLVGTTRAGAIAATALGLIGRLPVIVDHIDPISQLYDTRPRWFAAFVERFENLSFRLADHVLYVYEEEESRVARRSRSYSQTTLGVDYDRFANPTEASLEAANERLASRELNDNIVTYVGGLEPIYNVSTLIDAMDHLSGWSLVIAGAGSLEDEVSGRAANRDDVEFLGTVPHEHVPGYLHRADVGVSLVDDPHTLKVLEYLAASLPVVQVEGRARTRFQDFVTYCALDPTEVARGIEDASQREVNVHALEFAEGFSWESVSSHYEEVLRGVIEEH